MLNGNSPPFVTDYFSVSQCLARKRKENRWRFITEGWGSVLQNPPPPPHPFFFHWYRNRNGNGIREPRVPDVAMEARKRRAPTVEEHLINDTPHTHPSLVRGPLHFVLRLNCSHTSHSLNRQRPTSAPLTEMFHSN